MPIDQTAMLVRLQEFSAEFDVPMPELAYEDGDVLLDDALLEWHAEHEAPLDWILLGDVKPLLRIYRRHRESMRPVEDVVNRLDDEAQKLLLAGLHAHAAGVPMEEAMASVKQVVEERRRAASSS